MGGAAAQGKAGISDPLPAILQGFLTSTGMAAIDLYYSGRDVISPM
ncbi:MAG TPA: hypothetical protein VGE66_04035 [Chitinophagaceae bacterium]